MLKPISQLTRPFKLTCALLLWAAALVAQPSLAVELPALDAATNRSLSDTKPEADAEAPEEQTQATEENASSSLSQTNQEPLWELGIGFALANVSDYPGSDERTTLALPFPAITYRGNIIRADRNGISGLVFETTRWTLDVSIRGSLPVSSDDNDARRGMPDLAPTIEVGPELEWHFYDNGETNAKLQLPLRALVALDFNDGGYEGYGFSPHVKLSQQFNPQVRASLSVGLQYSNAGYHDYFHEVQPEFATNERPAYRADGGYTGSFANAVLAWQANKWRIAGALSYWSLNNAAYADSPLFKTDQAYYAGLIIARDLWQSKRRAGQAND